MRRLNVAALLAFLAVAVPLYAAKSQVNVYGITTNSSTSWEKLEGGLYVFEVYAPDDTNDDGTCSGGGDWDTAAATVEYSPDGGITATNSAVSNLVGATADVLENVQVARGYSFRLTVSSVGASTCLNFKMARSQ